MLIHQEIPCDLKLGSNAVEDACGVCHGDGTSCDLHEGKRFFNSSGTGGNPSSVLTFFT